MAPPPADARTALAERIAAIQARTARPNPVADDEARRIGEREDSALPSDPSLTHDQALANLREALPVREDVTILRTDDGRFLNQRTGQVFDTWREATA